jgi:hypothetical protein
MLLQVLHLEVLNQVELLMLQVQVVVEVPLQQLVMVLLVAKEADLALASQ